MTLELDRRGTTLWIWLNRPEVRNALDSQTLRELMDVFTQLADDFEVEAVVLAGRGPSFCAGADLTDTARPGSDSERAALWWEGLGERLIAAIDNCPVPTIARIHGSVVGGGMSLALACDFRIGSDDLACWLPEVDLGAHLGWGTLPLLLREVGAPTTRRMLLLGEKLSAREAASSGLIYRCLPTDELDAGTTALADAIKRKPHRAMRHLRAQLRTHATTRSAELIVRDEPLSTAQAAFSLQRDQASRGTSEVDPGANLAAAARKVAGPLTGIRIADFTSLIAGPYATRILSDLGAEVIKIEARSGDTLRALGPHSGTDSAYFAGANAGKRSIVLDLKSDDGLQIARDLIRASDVVVENMRPGAMDRLGLGYAELAAGQPGLIYCSVSGYMPGTPKSQDGGYATIVQAESGFDMMLGHYSKLAGPPNTTIPVADFGAAVYTSTAILAALMGRQHTGAGDHIHVSLMDSIVSFMMSEVQEVMLGRSEDHQIYPPIAAKDGFIQLPITTEANFQAVIQATGNKHWLDDERFSSMASRIEHWDEFLAELGTWVKARSTAECEATLAEFGIPHARYRDLAEALESGDFPRESAFVQATTGEDELLVPRIPIRLASFEGPEVTHVPGLGEHTDLVLREVLNVAAEEVDRLRSTGAAGM